MGHLSLISCLVLFAVKHNSRYVFLTLSSFLARSGRRHTGHQHSVWCVGRDGHGQPSRQHRAEDGAHGLAPHAATGGYSGPLGRGQGPHQPPSQRHLVRSPEEGRGLASWISSHPSSPVAGSSRRPPRASSCILSVFRVCFQQRSFHCHVWNERCVGGVFPGGRW